MHALGDIQSASQLGSDDVIIYRQASRLGEMWLGRPRLLLLIPTDHHRAFTARVVRFFSKRKDHFLGDKPQLSQTGHAVEVHTFGLLSPQGP